MDLLIVLDPLTALLLHLFHYVVTFILKQLVLLYITSGFEIIHVLHASLSTLILDLAHFLQGVTSFFLSCLGSASHAKEEHFFKSQGLNVFAGNDTFETSLDKEGSIVL